ncbi:cyanoexosortase A [Hassallia byssoidea VB512170]|uniref:Cyanoexosortase A n=1 Tax=Hassallia byssoidea VB512170 TaxID=1304833 RepID=A0A846HCP5_9CYAN|nr:cyanoexosortase A [Hassalia byssoidea]NEU75155.1 cyanoexosortase A [Hassalia byssoidea VB512170]
MKSIHLTPVSRLKNAQFWLLAIGAGLIAIHITLTCKSNIPSLLGSSVLFWIAVSSLIWEKRHSLNLESGVFPSFLGISIIAIVLIKSASLTSFGGFLFLSPFILAFGLALLASGFRGLKQYKGELLALFFLGAPKLLPSLLIKHITLLTAKLAAFILWYTGFEITRSGVNIYLPTGSIQVASGCSGVQIIFQQLGLAIIFILMFPLNRQQKILAPIVAATLGFIVNGVRVALMGVIVAKGNQEAFEYWHHGDGSLIFSMIAVILFGLFCWFLLNINETKNKQHKSIF